MLGSLNFLFSDVAVTFGVVVILNSLLTTTLTSVIEAAAIKNNWTYLYTIFLSFRYNAWLTTIKIEPASRTETKPIKPDFFAVVDRMYICWQIIKPLHSRGQLPCKIIGTKDIVYIRKEVCSRGITGRLECLYPCPHPTGHVRYINIPTWLSGQNCKFFNSRKRHGYKENNFPNLEICLQRLDAMSEY